MDGACRMPLILAGKGSQQAERGARVRLQVDAQRNSAAPICGAPHRRHSNCQCHSCHPANAALVIIITPSHLPARRGPGTGPKSDALPGGLPGHFSAHPAASAPSR